MTAYNALAKTYNDAVATEVARRKDAIKRTTTTPDKIPEVPCLTQRSPGSWADDLGMRTMASSTKQDDFANWTDSDKSSIMTWNYNAGVTNANQDFKSGYMQFSTDETGTTVSTVSATSHVFGLLGQKANLDLTTTKAFRFKVPSTNVITYMMVSLFPYD